MDAKYGLSKNLTLDLTINTDFAQAEVDDRIINLSKYEVNLPEKRSFFLESANQLSFGFPSGNELFITRRIGNENGVIVPIIGGVRLTGKVNDWQIGALNMQTKVYPPPEFHRIILLSCEHAVILIPLEVLLVQLFATESIPIPRHYQINRSELILLKD
ncbi:MAG: hypothetical protein IPH42_20940 [Bacteroidetes bacterium]|nr:hypothetical protein [Bacteroidota bacterium]